MRRIWIVGCGGFGFQVLSILMASAKFKNRTIHFGGFIDDRQISDKKANLFSRLSEHVRATAAIVFELPEGISLNNDKLIFGVSDPDFKLSFLKKHNLKADQFEPLFPNSPPNLGVKRGVSLLNQVKCSSGVTVGNFNFIDAGTVIGHDAVVGDNNHIGVNVVIGGGSVISDDCVIHSGAIIGNNVTIGNRCVIGIGCCVVRSLPDNTKLISPKPGYL